MAKKSIEEIEVLDINVKHAVVHIRGTSDLVLNKMCESVRRELTAPDRKQQKVWEAQHKNQWEDLITSLHWRDGIPITGDNSDGLATNRECSEEMFKKMLIENAPCISAFGMKKSWGQAVTQNKFDTYAVKFNAALNIYMPRNLIPIKFAEHRIETLCMNPPKKTGTPVTVHLHHFSGWSADINISFTNHVYQLSSIIAFIRYAGFGNGIGSGRSSGYGRYEVENTGEIY